jgi:hypothetical protein
VLLELSQHRIALTDVGDAPDPGARGAEGGLDEKRIRPIGREFVCRADDIGFGLRQVQPRQQLGETSLALDLFERLETGEGDAEVRGKLPARGGKQIRLLVHRKQRVDLAGPDGVNHGGEVSVRIGPRCRRPVHAGDKARETSKAQGIAGEQFNPVAGQPQCRDGFARRQAGAFAQKNLWSLRAHSCPSARSLVRQRREDKVRTGRIYTPEFIG